MGCVRIQEYDILKLAGVVIWRQKVVGTAVFWFEKRKTWNYTVVSLTAEINYLLLSLSLKVYIQFDLSRRRGRWFAI